jgi:KDO2-lipid IV(A) lauroyltransferase
VRRRSKFRNLVEYLLARVLLSTLSIGPFRWSLGLARFYMRVLAAAVPRLRRVAERNLELTGFPAKHRQESFHSLARMLATFARFPSIRRENVSEWIRYDGYEHYERALEKGKGVLFATAHLGNWELSAFAHALLAAPMSIVVRPLDNPLLDTLATKYRGLSGNTVLGKRDSARAILRALERNEAVGILVDQNVGLDEGIFIDFFGRKACVSPTFARIARRTGATVIPGFAVWNGVERRYILRFYDPLEMTGDEREDTQRIQAAVELAVREYPEQWLWAHRRWKTRPAGEAGLY